MTKQEFNKLLETEILPAITAMRDSGQKEYAQDKDEVFANFIRTGERLDISADKTLMVFMLKHIDGICAYIKGHKSQREHVTGRIADVIVYLMLLWGMIKEQEK
jgi:hypothetical protein